MCVYCCDTDTLVLIQFLVCRAFQIIKSLVKTTYVCMLIIVGHQLPSLKYLNRHVRQLVVASFKWYDLGIDLLEAGDVEELDIISRNPDIKTCCTKMFQLWLRKQRPTASWNQLINSLRQPGIELNHLATEIEQMLLQPKPTGMFCHRKLLI